MWPFEWGGCHLMGKTYTYSTPATGTLQGRGVSHFTLAGTLWEALASFNFIFIYLFLAVPTAWASSQARDRTPITAATRAAP